MMARLWSVPANQTIPSDGSWNLYQWRFQDAAQWEGFAGTGPNGQIDSTTTVTSDSIFAVALKDASIADQNAVLNIDYVATNPSGPIVIPEPSTGLLLGLAGALGAIRRRRA